MGILIFNRSSRGLYRGGRYSGEKAMGDLYNWRTLSADSNDILEGTYDTLSERSTTLYHTYGPAKSAIEKHTTYAIGPGLAFRSQPDYRMLRQTKEWAVDWGKDFQKLVHYYYNKMNFYEKQAVLFRSALISGDSFLYFERKNGELSDLIEFQNNQINSGYTQVTTDGEGYTLGIKHDKWLRPLGVKKYDAKEVAFVDAAGDQKICQFYIKSMASQLRGFPLAYSVINLARNDDTHNDAVTHRAVLESILLGMMKSNTTDFKKQAQGMARANRLNKREDAQPSFFRRIGNAARLGPGNVFQGGQDDSMEFSKLETPSNNFGPYKEYMTNYIGMGTKHHQKL